MFAEYGISKTYTEALAIAEEIVSCQTDELRDKYIRSTIYELVIVEVLKRFEQELEKYAGTYSNIDVTEQEVEQICNIVTQEMEKVAKLRIPLVAECGKGYNWLQAH